MSSQYDPLRPFLQQHAADRVFLTFAEIEQALGFPLPKSKHYPAWWSNNPSNNPMTKVWLSAGYRTEQVDTKTGTLVFRKSATSDGAVADVEKTGAAFTAGVGVVARLQAALAGTVSYAPDFDLTEPTGEIWDAEL